MSWRTAYTAEMPHPRKDATDRQPAAPQRRDHRARRSRQDHARGRAAAAERRVPRQPAGRRARDGQHRPRARARHHDPGEEHSGALQGPADQHRRHAGPRRFRRRGRADAVDGRRRACCWWTRPKARCRRRVSCCARRSSAGCRRSSSLNKIDRPDARPQEVLNEVYDLFIDLDATEEQIEFPVLYTNAREGTATHDDRRAGEDLRPLFEAIVEHVPPPRGQSRGAAADARRQPRLQRLPRPDRHRPHLQRHGRLSDPVAVLKLDGDAQQTRVTKLFAFDGLKRVEIEQARRPATSSASPASRTSRSARRSRRRREPDADSAHRRRRADGLDDLRREHLADVAGRDGQYVTSRNLRERLDKELLGNVSLRVEDTETPGADEGHRPRRAAARDPHRDDAARGLRDAGVAARDRHQGDRRQCRWSRSRIW